jgi:hypothetical protein
MAGAALATAAPASAEPAVGVIASAGNALVSFDTTKPGAYTSVRPITGLQPNERIAGLDFRYFPLGNGAKTLYAVGIVDGGATDAARVYTIDPGTGAATQVGSAPVTLTGGDMYGVDFNHTVDRIRVVNDGDENARLNPDTGGRADAPANDTDLAPAGQHLRAIAYDRVDNDPATPTTLYGISRNQRARHDRRAQLDAVAEPRRHQCDRCAGRERKRHRDGHLAVRRRVRRARRPALHAQPGQRRRFEHRSAADQPARPGDRPRGERPVRHDGADGAGERRAGERGRHALGIDHLDGDGLVPGGLGSGNADVRAG